MYINCAKQYTVTPQYNAPSYNLRRIGCNAVNRASRFSAKRLRSLEAESDRQEQYSRRLNLRIQGIADTQEGSTDEKVLQLVNTEMTTAAPLILEDLERSHGLPRPFAGQYTQYI